MSNFKMQGGPSPPSDVHDEKSILWRETWYRGQVQYRMDRFCKTDPGFVCSVPMSPALLKTTTTFASKLTFVKRNSYKKNKKRMFVTRAREKTTAQATSGHDHPQDWGTAQDHPLQQIIDWKWQGELLGGNELDRVVNSVHPVYVDITRFLYLLDVLHNHVVESRLNEEGVKVIVSQQKFIQLWRHQKTLRWSNQQHAQATVSIKTILMTFFPFAILRFICY